jgi:hypothetical protein
LKLDLLSAGKMPAAHFFTVHRRACAAGMTVLKFLHAD